MDDLTERFVGLIADHGEKAVIAVLADYCETRAVQPMDSAGVIRHGGPWGKLAYRLQGALDGMKRGEFGRVR